MVYLEEQWEEIQEAQIKLWKAMSEEIAKINPPFSWEEKTPIPSPFLKEFKDE